MGGLIPGALTRGLRENNEDRHFFAEAYLCSCLGRAPDSGGGRLVVSVNYVRW